MNPDIASIPLRDIHLPESISWWPLAPGWWITLGLLALAAVTVYLLKIFRDKQQLGKQSMQEFTTLVSQYQQDRDARQLLTSLSQLLRRVCITQFDDENIASLTGEAWLDFLDDALSNHKHQSSLSFRGELGNYLVTAQYKKSISIDEQRLDHLLILSKAWLREVSSKPNPTLRNNKLNVVEDSH